MNLGSGAGSATLGRPPLGHDLDPPDRPEAAPLQHPRRLPLMGAAPLPPDVSARSPLAGAGPIDPPPARELRQRWMVPLLGCTALFHLSFIISSSHRIGGRRYFVLFDDAAISMRYAENLAEGHGLLWNPGSPAVEGVTNPLWATWMAVLHLVGLPRSITALGVMITSSLLLLGCVVLVANVTRRLAPELPWAPPVAAVLTAAAYPLAYWSLRGMEVGAVSAAALGALVLALHWAEAPGARRWALHGIGALVLAMVATRLDAVVLTVPLVLWCVGRADPGPRRRRAVAVLGTWLLGGLLAMTALRLAYYGDLLPNTYYLKATGVPLGDRLARGARVLGDVSVFSLVAPAALAAGGVAWAAVRRRSAVLALPLPMVLAQLFYSVWVGGDAWEEVGYANRYIATVLPLIAVLGAIGAVALATSTRAERGPVLVVVLAAAAAGCLAMGTWRRNLLTAAVTGDWEPWRGWFVVAGLGLVAVTVAVGLAPIRAARVEMAERRGRRAAFVVVVTLVAILAANGNSVLRWHRGGPAYLGIDESWVEDGLLINACTAPGTTVGAFAAGQIIYYSDRPGVDLLGKSDRVIARMEPAGEFRPGHNKFSYERSVGQLRPDVVTDTGLGMPPDLLQIAERSGYEQIGRWLVHRDAEGIDRPGLLRGLSGQPAGCRLPG